MVWTGHVGPGRREDRCATGENELRRKGDGGAATAVREPSGRKMLSMV
jgi:hypothetical protein